ncbi:hypothetical protein ADL26_16490 [Thermoactinomyces vulgaris]|jgi:glutathione-regulated potassium-efflux system ancillary protein KefG|nr:hypothetical protein ADL26_16490 [Thermoactinomyces vulgaris]
MKTLVIVAHPNLDQSRINKRWVAKLREYPEQVTVHDLYATYPDGNIDVVKEQALVMEHDRIVFQFPFYWYSTPALLKQWQDDVLTYGWAYGKEGTKLHGKEFVAAVSIGAPKENYKAMGYSVDLLTLPLKAMNHFTGMTYLEPFHFYGANTATDEQIEAGAEQYVAHILNPALTTAKG